jgi:hypothetical protein
MAPALEVETWRAPVPAAEPVRLRITPERSVATVGKSVALRVEGAAAAEARCTRDGRDVRGPVLAIAAESEGVVEVACRAGEVEARAQVTFTNAARLPLTDPYAGGVILVRTRRRPQPLGPEGATTVGLASLDARIRALGLHALPAFPLDRSGTRDRSLSYWLALDVPEGVNFYQAAALVRGSEDVYSESYLPLAGPGLRVDDREVEVAALSPVRADRVLPEADLELTGGEEVAAGALPADLRAMSVARAWRRGAGLGATIAIVDAAVDPDAPALSANLVEKPGEYPGVDADGNGIPGDEHGVSFRRLLVAARDGAPPRLALALREDAPAARATALAALAAGASDDPTQVGVAPHARILPVEVALDPAQPASTWSQALGAAFAVTEGASVLTCAWEGGAPHWLLHDALRFAEDNCVVAVCAARHPPGASGGDHPRAWAPAAREASGAESDAALDAWTGETLASFQPRPLRGLLLARVLEAADVPADVAIPAPARSRTGASAATFAVGRAAGAVAVVRGLRPDLDPVQVREVLRAASGREGLDLGVALDAAEAFPEGGCVAPEHRRSQTREAASPWWRRIDVRVSTPGREDEPRVPEDPTDPRRSR